VENRKRATGLRLTTMGVTATCNRKRKASTGAKVAQFLQIPALSPPICVIRDDPRALRGNCDDPRDAIRVMVFRVIRAIRVIVIRDDPRNPRYRDPR
jgi:hypothetical protein